MKYDFFQPTKRDHQLRDSDVGRALAFSEFVLATCFRRGLPGSHRGKERRFLCRETFRSLGAEY